MFPITIKVHQYSICNFTDELRCRELHINSCNCFRKSSPISVFRTSQSSWQVYYNVFLIWRLPRRCGHDHVRVMHDGRILHQFPRQPEVLRAGERGRPHPQSAQAVEVPHLHPLQQEQDEAQQFVSNSCQLQQQGKLYLQDHANNVLDLIQNHWL